MTRPSRSSARSGGGSSPSNRRPEAQSSSTTSRLAAAASSRSWRRRRRGQDARGRILERRGRVEDLRASARGGRRDRSRNDPLGVERKPDETGAVRLERGDRAAVGRILEQDGVARVREGARDEVDRLLRSVGDEHLVGARRHPASGHVLRDPFAQRGESLCGTVGERARRSRREHAREGARERGRRQQVRGGERSGEGDPAPACPGRVERAETGDLASVQRAREQAAPGARGAQGGGSRSRPRRRPRRDRVGLARGEGEGPAADVGTHHAPLLELGVRRDHRVAVDAQTPREVPRRGQASGDSELALLDTRAHVLRDLQVPGGRRLV